MWDQKFVSLDAYDELARMFMAYVVASRQLDTEVATQENLTRMGEIERELAVIVEEITNARASEQ